MRFFKREKELKLPKDIILVEQRYEPMIIMHYQLLQEIKNSDDLVELCRSIFELSEQCKSYKQGQTRDVLREFILFAYRRGREGQIFERCQMRYPSFDTKAYKLAEVFQGKSSQERQEQVAQLLRAGANFRMQLSDFLVKLSGDDLRHLAFLLGSSFEDFSFHEAVDNVATSRNKKQFVEHFIRVIEHNSSTTSILKAYLQL
ncbi:MAG: hypothetical protein AAF614_24995 [Chloroflexota bacterium]